MVSIGFTGDFCPINRMEIAFQDNNWQHVLSDVQPFFQKNDFNVIDLECPLTKSTKGITKTGPYIKSLPRTAEMLPFLNCSLVATANNHFKDYGEKGMEDSYSALEKNKVSWFGSGNSLQEASKFFQIRIKNLNFAFINMTENEWSTTQGDEPGCNPLDLVQALRSIQEAKSKNDFVVVILHGGHEHYNLPSPRMKQRFRFMIDSGADAVVGHHTHIISGYEVYKGNPIFYSLGNFCFDWPGLRNGTWNKGMLLRLIFEKKKQPRFDFSFIRQNDDKPGVCLIKGTEKEFLVQEVEGLNQIITDDKKLEAFFDSYCKNRSDIMLTRIEPYSNRILAGLHKRKLIPSLMGTKKKKIFTLLTQCESHREVYLRALKSKLPI